MRAVGLKPIASGSQRAGPDAPLRNADALELQAAASIALPYDQVNPYCFEPAIAPHLAAAEAGRTITVESLVQWYDRVPPGPSWRWSKAPAAGVCRCTRRDS